MLESGEADQRALQKLALLCTEHPIQDSPSPMTSTGSFPTPASPSPSILSLTNVKPLHTLWTEGKAFDRLFNALMKYLNPSKVKLIAFVRASILTVTSG
jgi:CLIP-associating protein 1/2